MNISAKRASAEALQTCNFRDKSLILCLLALTLIETLNRRDLQLLSRTRIREARALLRAGHYSGAYYLSGYAVECALKACVARRVQQHDFPDLKTVQQSYTHKLEQLVGVAGIQQQLTQQSAANQLFQLNWTIVKDWSETARYNQFSAVQARDLYGAITARTNGILTWLRTLW
jgi:HEPN domain-containing protein